MFGCPLYVQMAPICLDTSHIWMPPCMFGYPHMFGCPLVCLDACCTLQHKESMCCQTKGVSICPIHLDDPICLDAPCMFGCHLYVQVAPICLETPTYVWMPPVCSGGPHMFGHSQICLDAPCIFGCLLYITTQRKHGLSD